MNVLIKNLSGVAATAGLAGPAITTVTVDFRLLLKVWGLRWEADIFRKSKSQCTNIEVKSWLVSWYGGTEGM